MNKFLIALMAFSVFATPAFAETNQFKNWQKNRQAPPVGNEFHDNNHHKYKHKRKRHGGDYNYWHGGHNNYWHGNNNNFYNDPDFWGGVAGGLIGGIIGGAIVDDGPGGPGPGCFVVLQPVQGPNNGVVYREVVLCN